MVFVFADVFVFTDKGPNGLCPKGVLKHPLESLDLLAALESRKGPETETETETGPGDKDKVIMNKGTFRAPWADIRVFRHPLGSSELLAALERLRKP
jgi:hypothetical protein